MKHHVAYLIAAALLPLSSAVAQDSQAPTPVADDAAWPQAWFEIFKLAPGKQEEFVRRIAQADEVAAAGGFPPTQLFFHDNGADFDVILFKPVTGIEPTPEQAAAMAKKRKELGLPSGPAYFVNIRELVAEHTDSKTYGPLSAATWLARLDKWRAENPPRKSAIGK